MWKIDNEVEGFVTFTLLNFTLLSSSSRSKIVYTVSMWFRIFHVQPLHSNNTP